MRSFPPADLHDAVLIADDHRCFADPMSRLLGQWFTVLAPVYTIEMLRVALALLPISVVVLDVDFNGSSSLEALPEFVSCFPATKFIVLTGVRVAGLDAVSLARGAFRFLTKLDDVTVVADAIRSALSQQPDRHGEGHRVPMMPDAAHQQRSQAMSTRAKVVWLAHCSIMHREIARMLHVSLKDVEYHLRRNRREIASR